MRTLRDLLADGRVHVVDGAMGTMLYGRGVFLNVCYDDLNLKQPDLVRDIHREYVRAGAELLETNTFGANPLKLAIHGLAGDTERINAAAAGLAREAAGARAAVAGKQDRPERPVDLQDRARVEHHAAQLQLGHSHAHQVIGLCAKRPLPASGSIHA